MPVQNIDVNVLWIENGKIVLAV